MQTRLIHIPSDPLCCRITAGGRDGIGYYCIYSGKREEVAECLRHVLNVLEEPACSVKVQNDS